MQKLLIDIALTYEKVRDAELDKMVESLLYLTIFSGT
jgi:hypothetical protein